MTINLMKDAHNHTLNNRAEIEQSRECGCIYCKRIFPASQVNDFIDDGTTALCPYCGIDAVIGDISGIDLTKKFLAVMNKHYF